MLTIFPFRYDIGLNSYYESGNIKDDIVKASGFIITPELDGPAKAEYMLDSRKTNITFSKKLIFISESITVFNFSKFFIFLGYPLRNGTLIDLYSSYEIGSMENRRWAYIVICRYLKKIISLPNIFFQKGTLQTKLRTNFENDKWGMPCECRHGI